MDPVGRGVTIRSPARAEIVGSLLRPAALKVEWRISTRLHICRGNFRSLWMCEGPLEPVAERVLGELPYDTFLPMTPS